MRKFSIISIFVVLILAVVLSPTLDVTAQSDDLPTSFHLRAFAPQAIGQYPDSFSYDGSEVRPQEWGFVEIHIDAETDTGLIIARFHLDTHQLDAETSLEDAVVTVIYPLFGMANAQVMPEYWEGGIADYADLHGDSGHEAPVLPTLFNNFGSWGPSLVFVNGEQYIGSPEFMGQENTFGLTMGHTMYSEVVRDPETGEVFAADRTTYFSPMDPGNGSVISEEIGIFHVVAHTETRDGENFPPFSMFLHVNFYEFEEIEARDDLSFLTWENMAEMDEETWQTWVEQWLSLADEIEAELQAETEAE